MGTPESAVAEEKNFRRHRRPFANTGIGHLILLLLCVLLALTTWQLAARRNSGTDLLQALKALRGGGDALVYLHLPTQNYYYSNIQPGDATVAVGTEKNSPAKQTSKADIRTEPSLRPSYFIHPYTSDVIGQSQMDPDNSAGLSPNTSDVISQSQMDADNSTDLSARERTLTGACAMVTVNTLRKSATRVLVESCAPFRSRRRVVIHQTQGTTGMVGRYELVDILSCESKVLRLRRPLKHAYASNVVGGTAPQVTQVVPILHGRNIKVCFGSRVEAPSWNGRCGGIIALSATHDIHVCKGSNITATGAGFRGAPHYVSRSDYVTGYIGESELMGFAAKRQVNGVGLGGGSGIGNCGGSGGAHKTLGTPGRKGWYGRGQGGPAEITLSSGGINFLYFGGSGGASGSQGPSLLGRNGAIGGPSGGIVMLLAGGQIKAETESLQAEGMPGQNGYMAEDAYNKQSMSGGGGGAGGTVLCRGRANKQPLGAMVSGAAGGEGYVMTDGRNARRGGTGGLGEIIILPGIRS